MENFPARILFFIFGGVVFLHELAQQDDRRYDPGLLSAPTDERNKRKRYKEKGTGSASCADGRLYETNMTTKIVVAYRKSK